jgi:UPF0176 protein
MRVDGDASQTASDGTAMLPAMLSTTLPAILNVAAYRFVPLDNLAARQANLRERANALGVRGTILLAEEGINLYLAAEPAPLRAFMAWLGEDPCFADLDCKWSPSETTPFRRMKVKIKRELIRMNHPHIRPVEGRAPAVDGPTLKRWLDAGVDDQGRPVVTLDTRNGFEVDAGAFDGAVSFGVEKFSDFPAVAEQHRGDFEGKTIVTYCTGGIRCEKAALHLQEKGWEHVYQLDGGILRYFELTGGAHYHGGCFVFDERRAVGADLNVTGL